MIRIFWPIICEREAMKILFSFILLSSSALAYENPTRDQIRLKLWYEGVSVKSPQTESKTLQKREIEEIERPLAQLFTEE